MASSIHEFKSPSTGFRWIDVSSPSLAELKKIAADFHLHETSVKDCLEPEHLPKYENHGIYRFVILRCYDESNGLVGREITELTRKVAFFIGDNFLITIHRLDITLMKALREKWKIKLEGYADSPRAHLVTDIFHQMVQSFDPPLDLCFDAVDRLEEFAFGISKKSLNLPQLYDLRRQVSTFKRILWLSSEVIKRFASDPEHRLDANTMPYIVDLKEDVEHTIFYVDDLTESLHQILNLYLAQESQRSNEAMRVLTVFSAFFMPITFIAGVYGMNFKYLPELEWYHGYFACLLLMLGVSTVIFIWFKNKRWL